MKLFRNRVCTQFFLSLLVVGVSIHLYSCANIARPTGGPVDDTPPEFVKSTPTPDQLNVKAAKLVLDFNENVKLEKPSEKIVVSPPQESMPIISSNGKRVTVELKDSLQANTTYTFDFTDAVQDNNEGNPLKDFSVAFSTGDQIDSLQISGTLLDASNLEPVTGSFIGIHRDLTDSAFISKPFTRISKTNEFGRFTIRNIAPGSYRVYALKDINSNYRFDLSNEDIAFLDTIVTPYAEIKLHAGVGEVANDSVESAKVLEVSHFYPDNLVLFAFNEQKKNLYLEKSERLSKQRVAFYFSAPEDSLPVVKGLNFDDTDWAILENSIHNDTLTYWIKDSLIYKLDTLSLTLNYRYTDTLSNLSSRIDTLNLSVRAARQQFERKNNSRRREDKEAQDSVVIEYLKFREVIPGAMDIGHRPRFIFEEPLVSVNFDAIRLEVKKDSVFIEQPWRFEPDSVKLREYELIARLMPGEEYVLTIDTAAFTGLYGLFSEQITKSFKVKKIEEYSNLRLDITGVIEPAFVELLDKSDKPITKVPVQGGVAKFIHLNPGTYYARVVFDSNGNGVYDTGNFQQKRQPEKVHYYWNPFELKANWDFQQDWFIGEMPITKEKPLEITKNKPKEDKKNAQKNNQNSSGGNSGSGQSIGSYGGGSVSGTIQPNR